MSVETLFYNGQRGRWIAVTKGVIVDLGFGKFPHLAQKKISLAGHPIYSGWIDSHVHLFHMGIRNIQTDVSDCHSNEDVRKSIRSNPKCAVIEAYGLVTEPWEGPSLTKTVLDAVSKNRPVIVKRADEHALWCNSEMLRRAGLMNDPPKVSGGVVGRTEQGELTGYFQDAAMSLILECIPAYDNQVIETAMANAAISCTKVGITSVFDMSTQRHPLKALLSLIERNQMPLRVNVALVDEETRLNYPKPLREIYDGRLSIAAWKVFIDGALGSRGAWLSEPYNDAPDKVGLSLFNEKDLLSVVRDGMARGFQMIFHTLGDEASRWLVEVLANNIAHQDIRRSRFRSEHLEVIDSKTLVKMRDLGMIASVQPMHAVSDSPWLEKRLGKDRLERVLPLRQMIDSGVRLCGGSDAPIEDHNPLVGLWASTFQQGPAWLKSQRIRLIEAMNLFSSAAAFAEFSENKKGSLDVGKWADFSVLSEDIEAIPPEKMLEVKNIMTVVGGQVVYEK